jgi:Tfp pilus assembly major pilin PilA
MTTRQKLYALGEPLGECVTTRKVGGGYVCGGGGGSSSSASNTSTTTSTTTLNTDKRITQQSGVAMTVDGSTVNVTNQSVDKDIVNKALDTVTTGNALQNDGFVKMLGLADKLFATADSTLKSTQATTLAQVGALTSAQNDAKGAIDQKTIVILAAAGVAGLALITRKK